MIPKCLLGWIIVLTAPGAMLLAQPTLTVVRRGLTTEGNLQWRVAVVPDPALFTTTGEGVVGGAVAVEVGFFPLEGGNILSITQDATNWPHNTPGLNPFALAITEGLWTDSSTGRAFASLGSRVFLSGSPVALATIVTAGSAPTKLGWGGQSFLVGTPFAYVGGRLAQGGTDFDSVAGSLAMRLGDLDFDSDVDSHDLLELIGGWTGVRSEKVSVALVPEPATILLLSVGGLGVLRRRSRN